MSGDFGIIRLSMSSKFFLWLIVLGTIISWISWGSVIFNFDPNQISFLGLAMFYLSLFFGLAGLIFLLSYWLKSKLFKKQLLFPRLRTSVRHAVFFSILILGWAFLKSQNLLRWWLVLLFILILTVLEFFFISSQKQRHLINDYERKNSTTQGSI